MKFPEGFLWGQAAEAGQTEENIARLAKKGFKCFYTTIDWVRIFPSEEGEPDESGLKYYDSLFDLCREYGIEPVIIIGHQRPSVNTCSDNGWEDRRNIEFFEKYAKILFERYREKVKMWLTFADINSWPDHDSSSSGQPHFQALHNQMVAGARVVRYAHIHYPDFLMGNMIAFLPIYPLISDSENMLAAQEKMQMADYFCSDIQLRGEYPYYAKRYFKETGTKIKVDPMDMDDLAEGTEDFYTLSYNGNACLPADQPCGMDPEGLRWSLNEIYSRYQIPIMVVEDTPPEGDAPVEDAIDREEKRTEYQRKFLEAMGKAAEDGVDIVGYVSRGDVDPG